MDGLLEIIVLISLLFTVAIYIQLWMRNKQSDNMDLIINDIEINIKNIAMKIAITKIKRPASSFILFSTKKRNEMNINLNLKNLTFKEKAQMISNEYKNMDHLVRSNYHWHLLVQNHYLLNTINHLRYNYRLLISILFQFPL